MRRDMEESEAIVDRALEFVPTPEQRVSKYDNLYLERYYQIIPRRAPVEVHVPWYERFDIGLFTASYRARDIMVRQYAWAVPSDAAIDLIAKYSPLIEIGAGTGYWAWMLTQAGADIICFDIHPPDTLMPKAEGEETILAPNHYLGHHQTMYHPVKEGGPEKVAEHPDRNLFLCWPPYNDPMAFEALTNFTGRFVIFIGEGDGGCTGDDAFFNLLTHMYEEVTSIEVPQWQGLHDYLTVYERRGTRRLPNPEGKSTVPEDYMSDGPWHEA